MYFIIEHIHEILFYSGDMGFWGPNNKQTNKYLINCISLIAKFHTINVNL